MRRTEALDRYALWVIGLRLARGELLHVLRKRCSWPEGEPDPPECPADGPQRRADAAQQGGPGRTGTDSL